ncbi:MAG: acetyl-CoA C-acetyltransferase [Alphaproteobacteria bacterium]|nr:acetyl-CoA C-acetyltransferase [Alphaproteobacteria bacterium]MDA8003952.1 acetyl-CoA C-acetyltransferase [Alphaproteobacteria bacterium]MDA8006189.1 acetyl-CoA C-acetyltransferase [Alphaproteobacteria bacterium]MDA8012602.1 acetyl-CoA C-acetyltransferase [Alphaproteobacteria bacterium]
MATGSEAVMVSEQSEVWIVGAKRTPVGKMGGALSSFSAAALGGAVIQSLLDGLNVDGGDVSEVIMGQVLSGGAGQNPARQAARLGGLPVAVPALTINQVCGSGQKAIHLGVQSVRCGDGDIVVAGGQESMSRAPHVADGVRRGVALGDVSLRDMMISDGLWDAFHDVHMGMTAEHLARKFGISREEQDAYALGSHERAVRAQEAGHFKGEIVGVDAGRGVADVDECPRRDTGMEALGGLRAVFASGGSVTAGNASGLSDGAAAVVLMSGDEARRRGLGCMARVVSYASVGLEPMEMGMGPVLAVRRALDLAGWELGDVDLLEVNEAFAVQTLAVGRELGLDFGRLNVNGGAVAMGHPLGASGARIVVSLLHEMSRRDAGRGVASLCIGGGMGVALCVERDRGQVQGLH